MLRQLKILKEIEKLLMCDTDKALAYVQRCIEEEVRVSSFGESDVYEFAGGLNLPFELEHKDVLAILDIYENEVGSSWDDLEIIITKYTERLNVGGVE